MRKIVLAAGMLVVSCGGSSSDGVNGPSGSDGADGTQGPVGPQGEQGPPGAQGPQGPTGPAGVDGATAQQSGSRIRARYLEGSDGSRQFIGWHDSQRGEDCNFVPIEGATRCMPSIAYGYAFQDQTCTTPVLLVTKPACGGAAAVPTLAWYDTDADACTLGELRSVGAQAAIAKVYIKSGGNCVEYPGALMNANAYAFGAPVPASDFVEASTVIE